MASSVLKHYQYRNIIDIKSLTKAFRLLIINAILAIIFLFLALEEIDWAICSFSDNTDDLVIDNTAWNLNSLFKFSRNLKNISI